MAAILLWTAAAYVIVGSLFAIVFVCVGAARVDSAAAGASWGFRVLILPGVAALWPLLALRWRRAAAAEAHP